MSGKDTTMIADMLADAFSLGIQCVEGIIDSLSSWDDGTDPDLRKAIEGFKAGLSYLQSIEGREDDDVGEKPN